MSAQGTTMVEPNWEHPTALRIQQPFQPDRNPYQQYWDDNRQPEAYDIDSSSHELSPQDPVSQFSRISPTPNEHSEMAMQQQPNSPSDYGDKSPIRQTPTQVEMDSSTGFRAIGPDDAPRTRSSAFGMRPAGSSVQVPKAPIPQQPTYMSNGGPSNTQSQEVKAGPSYTRPAPEEQSNSAASLVHRPGTAQTNNTNPRPSTSTRSPFTTPVTSPPRARPNQILLINPTSTSALTTILLNTLRPVLPNALEITGYHAQYPAPTVIESVVDSVLSSETVLRDLAKYSTNNGETIQNYDALLVASYSKHPLIDALRESYDVPVIGILEASLYVARMLGGRFGIVTTSTRMKLQIDDAVASYGLSHFFVGIESLHITPLELLNSSFTTSTTPSGSNSQPSSPTPTARSKEDLYRRLSIQSKALVAKGADTVILGSEFLTSHEASRVVKDAVRDDDGRRTVNVVDAVEAGVVMLNSLVAMGVPTSKKGIYRAERDARRGRGQTWL